MKNRKIFDILMGAGEKIAPGVYGGLVCRVRYLDDVIKNCLSEGFEAIVNLGGGYDSRVLRIPGMESMEYYHIDQPDVVAGFERRICEAGLSHTADIRYVPIDFNTESLVQALGDAGYDPGKKTLFLWEGVTQYLEEEAVAETLRYIAATMSGSRVAFTDVLMDYLEYPEAYPQYEKLRKSLKRSGVHWLTGFDPGRIESYLEGLGFKVIEDIGEKEYQERYVQSLDRELSIMPIERMVLAEVV